MQEEEIRNNERNFEADVTIGIVAHCSLEHAIVVKKWLLSNSELDIIFFKTTSGKLWLKEGELDE